jgi:hypothetical protein
VKWILKLDDYGFSPRLDLLWQMVEKLAVKEREALKLRYKAQGRKSKVYDAIGSFSTAIQFWLRNSRIGLTVNESLQIAKSSERFFGRRTSSCTQLRMSMRK